MWHGKAVADGDAAQCDRKLVGEAVFVDEVSDVGGVGSLRGICG